MRVIGGCLICQADVLGTLETGFYCRGCNLLFGKKHVDFSRMKAQARELIEIHFSATQKPAEKGEERRPVPKVAARSGLKAVRKRLGRGIKEAERVREALDQVRKVFAEVSVSSTPAKGKRRVKKRNIGRKAKKSVNKKERKEARRGKSARKGRAAAQSKRKISSKMQSGGLEHLL